ncbi:Trichome birefringence-like, N-terminal domain [Dillenia turbinata]|uniref:Trichome birefringence-like, N-terminal domain n=1 Tax=Dillenia turbinata TaxID=194707 RepID=A0AAN8UPY2_9MAGN
MSFSAALFNKKKSCIILVWRANCGQFDHSSIFIEGILEPSSLAETGFNQSSSSPVSTRHKTLVQECDIYNGKWVYNPKAYPLYKASQCPLLPEKSSCRINGRPDSKYEEWSWESKDCHIPRFNGTDLLERLRNKRVIIAGDSMNRNQWESLYCLLYTSLPSPSPELGFIYRKKSVKIFKLKDYNCTIEFYWNPFLVEFDRDVNGKMIVNLDKIPKFARKWHGASIMLFNTGHWWVHAGKKKPWDFFQYKGELLEDMDLEVAFKVGMELWARWIDANVDSTKTMVVFRSITPLHYGNQWCYGTREPMKDDEIYVSEFPQSLVDTVEKTIKGMRIPVKYMNITKLSQYRRDAHLSIYGRKDREGKEFWCDCSHWCLPGVPDTWNRLLYSLIVVES